MRPIAESGARDALRGGWRRLFSAMLSSPARHTAPDRPSAIDPIALTVMAVNRLGPARLRTGFHGVPVTVAAPDPATVAIFRAALSQMAKERPTDRLISVELITDADSEMGSPAEPPAH